LLAHEYCSLIDFRSRMRTYRFLTRLLGLLPTLCSAVLRLPPLRYGALGGDERMTFARSRSLHKSLQKKLGRYDYYAEIFDPYNRSDQTPVVGSLADDLFDVYVELHAGLQCYRERQYREALWTWRFGFEVHWGEHATGATRALWWLHRESWERPVPFGEERPNVEKRLVAATR